MVAAVHVLHPHKPPVAGFLRVGHTGHRRLLELHAAGRIHFQRVVFDAAHIEERAEPANALRSAGYEIVLDPNFAEMASPGRIASSSIQKLPWANSDRPWYQEDFNRKRNENTARDIAGFAVKAGVDAVLAPTHSIERVDDMGRS